MAEGQTQDLRRTESKRRDNVSILLEDTRNQVGQHKNIEAYCRRRGIQIVRKKLDVGDYMLPGGRISVDTKQDILELAKNVCSSDHRRFKAECVRAQGAGIQLVILIEEEPPFGRLDLWEVPRFRSSGRYHRYGDPMTLIDPATLRKACITMQEKYGVKFRFCRKRVTPSVMMRYLKGELK